MRNFFAFVMFLLAASAQAQTVPTKEQCNALIGLAMSTNVSGAESVQILNGATARECFRRYPALEYKYFPLTSDESGVICDRGPTRKGKCPNREPDPNYPVKLK